MTDAARSPITRRLEKQGADMASRDLSPSGGVKLDTSGHVRRPGFAKPLGWTDLDPFEQGYIEALFAGPIIVGDGAHTYNSVLGLGFSDLAPETLARIIADCAAFLAEVTEPNWTGTPKWHTAERGRDFWGSRDGGAWTNFPPLTPYLGDDGRVYLREGV